MKNHCGTHPKYEIACDECVELWTKWYSTEVRKARELLESVDHHTLLTVMQNQYIQTAALPFSVKHISKFNALANSLNEPRAILRKIKEDQS